MAIFGKKKFVQCDTSALVNNKSNICIKYNHVLIMNWSWPIHRDGSSQKRLRNLASTIKCIFVYNMAQAARLFFRQVDTMQKQIFEYKKFKKSEKFIKNAYHKRFLKSSSFHFFKKNK